MAVDNRNFVNTFANEGGADVLVEDKRMDELKSATAKTGSQISTSAQYIPLQDTDGNLVKINPASFEEAVRNVLGSLLANNDKGTTISGIPALSGSGASLDFGSVSPANLASVLGVKSMPMYFAGTGNLDDANNAGRYTIYYLMGQSTANLPLNSGYFYLMSFGGFIGTGDGFQLAMRFDSAQVWYRTCINGTSGQWILLQNAQS